MYRLVFAKAAQKDKILLKRAGLEAKTKELLDMLIENPYKIPPTYEKLSGDLAGLYSRRINRQHRLLYSVDTDSQEIHILRMWTYYE